VSDGQGVREREGEPIVVKAFPNAFTGTDLDSRLSAAPGRGLILAGFMTQMCVNSTVRKAFSPGYRPAVVAQATAMRALPGRHPRLSPQPASPPEPAVIDPTRH
jgi:nicotinamidase-related amidase